MYIAVFLTLILFIILIALAWQALDELLEERWAKLVWLAPLVVFSLIALSSFHFAADQYDYIDKHAVIIVYKIDNKYVATNQFQHDKATSSSIKAAIELYKKKYHLKKQLEELE